MIIYNVPTRTCVNISIASVKKLAEHENVCGLKESSDSLKRLSDLFSLSDVLPLYSGNDYANYSFYTSGGAGAISVLSNLYPKECKRVFQLCIESKLSEARALQRNMNPLIETLFEETNPSVVKFAMQRHGLCSEELRLPLTPPTSQTRGKLATVLENYEKTLHG